MRYPNPSAVREARVRREYAHLYEGWDLRTWAPAAEVADWIGTQPGHRPDPRPRSLPDERFEFRGGAPRPPGLRARTRRSD